MAAPSERKATKQIRPIPKIAQVGAAFFTGCSGDVSSTAVFGSAPKLKGTANKAISSKITLTITAPVKGAKPSPINMVMPSTPARPPKLHTP